MNMRKKKKSYAGKISTVSAAVLAALTMPVWAAAADTATVQTKDVIVTATKTEAEVKAVPQAVEVITQEDIQRTGANDVLTALSLANNLNLSRAGMTGNAVSLRGMSTNHTLILVDGKRYAGEDTDVTTNVYNLQRLNVSDIDRVEIVRGPSSSLYGSDAMGGVINIITKTPEKASGTVGVVTGTRNTAEYFNFSTGKHGRWSAVVDGRFDKQRVINRYAHSVSSAGAVTDGYDRSMYGMRRTFHGGAVYDFENANNNKLRFDIDYMKEDLRSDYADTTAEVFTSSGPVMTAKTDILKTNLNKREWYHNEQKGFSVEYTGKTKRNEYQVRSYYNVLEKHSNLVNDRTLPKENVTIIIPPFMVPGGKVLNFNYAAMYPKADMEYAKYNTWVTEAKDTMYIGDRHNLTFGGEYRRLAYEGTRLGGSTTGLDKKVASKDVNSYAGYIEDMWQVNDKLLLIPSVRLEHNSQFGSATTPKIGVTYAINNAWRFKANYGKGYKAPTLSELNMEMHRSMGPMVVNVYGNPKLQPETTRSYDFSLEMEKGKNFGKLTYFNNNVTNLISTEDLGGNTYTYVNINKAKLRGVEFEIGRHITDRWTVKATYNYLNAIDAVSRMRLNNRARNTTTFQLIYDDHKEDGFSAVLWDQFVSRYRLNNQDYTYNTLNFSMNKKWTNSFSTYAGIDNIFNKKIGDLYIDGRMWRVGAEWKL